MYKVPEQVLSDCKTYLDLLLQTLYENELLDRDDKFDTGNKVENLIKLLGENYGV